MKGDSIAEIKTISKIWTMLKKAAGSSFGVKLYFVVITGLAEVPYLSYYFVSAIKYGLIWAMYILVVDFFTERRFMKSKNIALFVFMLLSYFVTIVLNYKVALGPNLLNYCYMVLIFFVLYPSSSTILEKDHAKRQMRILGYVLVITITAMSIVGLAMFFAQFMSTAEYNGVIHPVGFAEGRLTGIYRNAIYPTAAIGVIVAVMQMVLLKLADSKQKWRTALLSVSIVINLWHVVLSDARGNAVGLMAFLALFSLLVLLKKLREKPKVKAAFRVIISLAIAVALSAGLYYGISLARTASAYIPSLVSDEESGKDIIEQIEMERPDAPDAYGVLTGRTLYWEFAMQEVPKNPLFGTGPFYHSTQDTKVEGLQEKFSHFHNVYIQSLVALGLVGFIPFVLIIALSLWLIIRLLIKNKNEKEYTLFAALFGLLAFLLTINLNDTTILLIIKQSGFVFWIYLGYAMTFADDRKPCVLNKPFIALDNKLQKCFSKGKMRQPRRTSEKEY